MDGWIRLWRQLLENPLWVEKPFSRGQAWVDLLMLANHKENTVILGNLTVVIKRGQLHTSELNLAKRWGWSRKKVRAYLTLLKRLKMATTQGTAKGTTITIENYEIYQGEGTAEGPTEGTLKEPQRNRTGYTNKNVKNDKNEKEDIYSTLPIELHEPLNEFLRHRKQIKKPMSDHAIKLMLKKLVQLSEGNTEEAKQILEQSIVNGWVGIFPIKDKQKADILTEIIKEGMRGESSRDSKDYENNPIPIPSLIQE